MMFLAVDVKAKIQTHVPKPTRVMRKQNWTKNIGKVAVM